MERISTLSLADPRHNSLRTTVPMDLIEFWKLKAGDKLAWEFREDGDTVIIRKAKKASK